VIARRTLAGAALLLAVSSCSLFGLSSKITVESCEFDSDCDPLNDPALRQVDHCKPYRCGADHFCESVPLDFDRDGFLPFTCERDPQKVDCNDLNANIYPGAREFCDNEDDDCDSSIDEGVLDLQAATALEFPGPAPSSEIEYAVNSDRSLIGLGYALATQPPTSAVNVLSFDIASPQSPLELQFEPPRGPADLPAALVGTVHASVARVGFVPPSEVLLAAYLSDAPARLVVGSILPPEPLFSVTRRIASYGLSCAPLEDCAANAQQPAMSVAVPYTTAPRIAAGGEGTLVLYARDPAPEVDLCSDAHAAKPLLANVLALSARGWIERSEAALEVGSSGEGRTPALVALPWLTTNGASFGWLISYPEADGTLVVAQIAGLGTPQVRPLVRVHSAGLPLRAAELALGRSPDSMQRTQIAVSALRGCGAASRAVFSLFEGTLHSDATLELRESTPFEELGGGDSQRQVSLAYRDEADQRRRAWAVTYRDATGLRARLLSDAGLLLGPEPYRLLDSPQLRGETSGLVAVHGSVDWFAAYALATDPGPSGARLVRAALRSCD
jgi:hypothetical protein